MHICLFHDFRCFEKFDHGVHTKHLMQNVCHTPPDPTHVYWAQYVSCHVVSRVYHSISVIYQSFIQGFGQNFVLDTNIADRPDHSKLTCVPHKKIVV